MERSVDERLRELATISAELSFRLERVEATLSGLEGKAPKAQSPQPVARPVAPAAARIVSPPPAKPIDRGSGEAFNWLGFTGVGCFVLAAIYLVRLSIESGWLTPERQIHFSCLFGILLILAGESTLVRDRRYASLLGGAGAVIVHLTIYAAHFLHSLIPADSAFLGVSAAALLSILLYLRNRFDFYLVTGILGTYFGFIALGGRIPDTGMVTLVLLTWNVVYTLLSVWQRERYILHLAGYLAFFVVALRGSMLFAGDSGAIWVLVTLQFIQFLIFASGTLAFTVLHRQPLTSEAAWSMFPLLLLFYASQYRWFGMLYPGLEPWFGLAVGGLFLAVYLLAAKWLPTKTSLASGPMLFTLVAGIAFHAIFVELLVDGGRIFAGWVALLAIPLIAWKNGISEPGSCSFSPCCSFGPTCSLSIVRAARFPTFLSS